MRIVLGFLRGLALWTVAILLPLGAVTVAGGGLRLADLVTVWLPMSLALAAYPAGLGVSASVLDRREGLVRRGASFLAAALLACALSFGLVNGVAPYLASGDVDGPAEARTMPLTALADAAQRAADDVPEGSDRASDWRHYNMLAYTYVRRVDGSALPFLLAFVGLFLGRWTGRVGLREARQTLHLGGGAFLLISTYLAGENGFELVALRAGAPVDFAGDLVLVVPAALAAGLGVPTLLSLFTTDEESGVGG